MTILTDPTHLTQHPHHPAWCDPRACQTFRTGEVRHSQAPITWKARHDDVVISTAETRDDVNTPDGGLKPTQHGLTLRLVNTASDTASGEPIAADVFLTPADALRLASYLMMFFAAPADDTRGGGAPTEPEGVAS